MLGVTPTVGRTFTEEDERLGGPAIVLISERLWDRLFRRDPAVVGRTLRLDDRSRTIVGVVPSGADFGVLQVLSAADYSRGFADRDARSIVDVWAPLQANPEQLVRDTHPLLMLGRLAPGATLPSAQDELASIAADLERAYRSNKARGVFLEPQEMTMRQVTPGYFRALRVPLVRGRLLADRDATSAPAVVLLNEAAAQRLFPAGDELGQQISFWGARRTIVGVVGNEKFHGLTEAAPIAAYMPLTQAPSRGGGEVLLVRTTSGEPEMLVSAVRGAIADIDPALAMFGVEPLATVGIHGVLSYAVAQRTREIGIRLALGASPRTVMRMVLGQVARLTLWGLALGLVLGVGFSRSLAGLLFGVGTTDLATYAGVLIMLGAVAMLATVLPLRRAVRVDPTVALRPG